MKKPQTEKQIVRAELIRRREKAKGELLHIGVIDKPLIRFQRKYPEFTYEQVRMLWYTNKTMGIDFVRKLEAFVEFSKVYYE